MEVTPRAVLALTLVSSSIAFAGCGALADDSVKHNVVVTNNDNESHSARIVISTDGEAVVEETTQVGPDTTETLAPLESAGNYSITVYVDGENVATNRFEVRNLDGDRIGHTSITIDDSGDVEILILYQT